MEDYIVIAKTREGRKVMKVNGVDNRTNAIGRALEELMRQNLQPLEITEAMTQAEYHNHKT